jgi:hypothetical protein
MSRTRRWSDRLRQLVNLDRTPEEVLNARLDEIEKQLRERQSNGRGRGRQSE